MRKNRNRNRKRSREQQQRLRFQSRPCLLRPSCFRPARFAHLRAFSLPAPPGYDICVCITRHRTHPARSKRGRKAGDLTLKFKATVVFFPYDFVFFFDADEKRTKRASPNPPPKRDKQHLSRRPVVSKRHPETASELAEAAKNRNRWRCQEASHRASREPTWKKKPASESAVVDVVVEVCRAHSELVTYLKRRSRCTRARRGVP